MTMPDVAPASICQKGYLPPVQVVRGQVGNAPPGVVPTEREQARRPGLPAEVSSLVGRGPQVAAVLDRLRRVVLGAGWPGAGGGTGTGRPARPVVDRYRPVQ